MVGNPRALRLPFHEAPRTLQRHNQAPMRVSGSVDNATTNSVALRDESSKQKWGCIGAAVLSLLAFFFIPLLVAFVALPHFEQLLIDGLPLLLGEHKLGWQRLVAEITRLPSTGSKTSRPHAGRRYSLGVGVSSPSASVFMGGRFRDRHVGERIENRLCAPALKTENRSGKSFIPHPAGDRIIPLSPVCFDCRDCVEGRSAHNHESLPAALDVRIRVR